MSVRIVSAVWWFFTFIMVSTYTANFAALLTSERMTTPICSIDELIAQRSVRFGTLANSSTLEFFKVNKCCKTLITNINQITDKIIKFILEIDYSNICENL